MLTIKFNNLEECVDLSKELKIMSWNLGNSTHFFDSKYKDRKKYIKNLIGQVELIKNINADFILLQEVTGASFWNLYINPYKKIKKELIEYNNLYGENVKIWGIINHGKASFSKINCDYEKVIYPYNLDGFSNNLLNRNKTTLITRVSCKDEGKELVLMNIHFPTYKKNTDKRFSYMKYIFDLAKKEYNRGNYVVIGGDFNISIPIDRDYSKSGFSKELLDLFNEEGFMFATSDISTHKILNTKHEYNYDGFLLSPNLKGDCKSLDNFKYSDHSPVILKLKSTTNLL